MRIAILHHHLRRGGVTRVIAHAAAELTRRGHRVVVLSGEPVAEPSAFDGIEVMVVDGLGYAESSAPAETGAIKKTVEEEARIALGGVPDIWHFHNHSLGKNPAYTDLAAALATAGAALLLQLHDFAEDGRPANYARLAGVQGRLYPQGARITYAVLNNRDADCLRLAGVPQNSVRLVPNPVVAPVGSPKQPPPADADLLLCPVRGIRRKNIGEMVLLAVALAGRYRLALTLPPENPIEREPYDQWVAFAEHNRIAVELAAGTRSAGGLGELLNECLAVISTSVKEGFGLGFLEPWLARRAVTGRNIPYVTDDFAGHGIELDNLYERLPVPLAIVGGSEALRRQQRAALASEYAAYGRDLKGDDYERAYAAAVDSEECVDFGKLSAAMQRDAIIAVQASAELRERIANGFTAGQLATVEQIARNAEKVAAAYSVVAHASGLESCYEQAAAGRAEPPEFLDPSKVLAAFLDPAKLLLLMH